MPTDRSDRLRIGTALRAPRAPALRAPERVLIVAGSDSGGGAGIQADIKTVTALGGYAATAITALTAQNTLGVQGVLPVPPGFVREQIESVLADIGADIIKTGMLVDAPTIEAVAAALAEWAPGVPLVLDPVMLAKGGTPLLDAGAVDVLRRVLLPRAAVLTPNAPEAAALTGRDVRSRDDMVRAATALLDAGSGAVLVKGGHLPGDLVVDMLATAAGVTAYESPRLATRRTHGTGCTLASAIAVFLARGIALHEAVGRARAYVHAAIAAAPAIGAGHGPLNHALAAVSV